MQMSQKKQSTLDTNKSLERAFLILEHLAQCARSKSVPEISRTLNLNKVTTYKLIRTLESLGYVCKFGEGKYAITSRMFEFGSMFSNNNSLLSRFFQEANVLIKAFSGSEVYLGVMEDVTKGVYLGAVGDAVMFINSGTHFPLYATAVGKVLLAFASPEIQEEFFAQCGKHSLTQFTHNTTINANHLSKQLLDIKKRGYYINKGEYIMNTYFIAAPVYNSKHELLAAVSIGSKKDVFIAHQYDHIKKILSFATRLSSYVDT